MEDKTRWHGMREEETELKFSVSMVLGSAMMTVTDTHTHDGADEVAGVEKGMIACVLLLSIFCVSKIAYLLELKSVEYLDCTNTNCYCYYYCR